MWPLDSNAIIGAGVLLGAGLVFALLGAVWVTASRLRHPARRTYAWAIARGVAGDPGEMAEARAFDEIEIDLGNGSAAAAWVITGKNKDGPVVVLTPGWGSSKLGALVRLPGIEGWASRIIACDPPGYGDTPGACALGTREPEQIARIADRFVGEGGVVLMGWSLGGGASMVAGTLCEERGMDVRAVIAEAPYRKAWTPAVRVMRNSGMPWRANAPIAMGLLGVAYGVGPFWRGFDRAGWASRLACPLLVLHGSADPVSPIEDGREIAAGAPAGTMAEIEGGGHNNLWSEVFIEGVAGRVEGFVAQLGAQGE